MGGVERNLSVDDLVGGLWRIGQAASGFHRTDSEAGECAAPFPLLICWASISPSAAPANAPAAFQEFLKRIPSASNLTDSASAHTLSQMGGAGVSMPSSIPPPPMQDHLPGMPRVPSLDFLRQLASVQQQIAAGGNQGGVKLDSVSTPPPGEDTEGRMHACTRACEGGHAERRSVHSHACAHCIKHTCTQHAWAF
jgi:hypothetical protein